MDQGSYRDARGRLLLAAMGALVITGCAKSTSTLAPASGPGPTFKPAAGRARPAEAPFKGLRVYHHEEERLRVFQVANRSLEVLLDRKFSSPIQSSQLLDNGRLALLLDDGQVQLVDQGVATKIAMPAPSVWTAPRPGGEDLVQVKFPYRARLISSRKGELWLVHCAWLVQGDDDPCTTRVHGRLLPSFRGVVSRAPPRPEEPGRPDVAAAAQYEVKISTPAEGVSLMTCSHHGKARVRVRVKDESCTHSLSVAWVRAGSRHYVLTDELDCGMSEKTTLTMKLMRACDETPVDQFSSLVQGPGAVWAHDSELGGQHWVVLRGMQVIGRIKGWGSVGFSGR